jgi:hypothetical protein
VIENREVKPASIEILRPVGRIPGVDQPLDRLAVDDDGLVLLDRSGRVVVVIALCAFEVIVSVVRTCDASSGWRIVHCAQQIGGAEP